MGVRIKLLAATASQAYEQEKLNVVCVCIYVFLNSCIISGGMFMQKNHYRSVCNILPQLIFPQGIAPPALPRLLNKQSQTADEVWTFNLTAIVTRIKG